MSDERKGEAEGQGMKAKDEVDTPAQVEGQRLRWGDKVDTPAQVEGQAMRGRGYTNESEAPDADTPGTDDRSTDEPEVEGQKYRLGDKVDTPAQVEGHSSDTKVTADEKEVEGQKLRLVDKQ